MATTTFPYTRERDGKVAVCPECGLAVVWDSDLWHCDLNQHGAWDHAAWVEPDEAGLVACAWFALCDHPATHLRPHPVLGAVPICDRCEAVIS